MTYPLSFVTKMESIFRYESGYVLRGRVSIGVFVVVRGCVFFLRDVVRTFCIFSFLSILDTLFLHCDIKPCTLIDIYIYIYIYIYIEVVITFFHLSLHMLFLFPFYAHASY